MGESPRWHDGRFWMCDWLAGQVLVFDADGNREVAASVDGLPFSIDWLPDGRLVATTPAGVVVGKDLSPYGATVAFRLRPLSRASRPFMGPI